jgi:hypothetical protein
LTDSLNLCDYLVQNIVQQESLLITNRDKQQEIRNKNKTRRIAKEKVTLNNLKDDMNTEQLRALAASQEKGASSLFTTLPLKQYGFALSRSQFTDSLLMRYRLPLPNLPTTCVCGKAFSLDHSQICHLGGFINQRHDEVRNLLNQKLCEVLRDVEREPRLKPLAPTDVFNSRTVIIDQDARSDIRARGFWSDQMDAFFDVRVFYPNASSYLNRDLRSIYASIEKQKKNQYGERITNIDHGSFTPLVCSTSGGVGEEANRVIKKLATMLAEKHNESYSHIVGHLRASIAFSLCRAANICLRGTRRRRAQPNFTDSPTIYFSDSRGCHKLLMFYLG